MSDEHTTLNELEILDGALSRLRADKTALVRDEHGALDRPDPDKAPPAWLEPADAADGRWYFGRWDHQGWGSNQSFGPITRNGGDWLDVRGDACGPPAALYGPIEPQADWFDLSEDDES